MKKRSFIAVPGWWYPAEEVEQRIAELEARYKDACSENDSMLSELRRYKELEAEHTSLKIKYMQQSIEAEAISIRLKLLVEALDDIASGELGINVCIKRARKALVESDKAAIDAAQPKEGVK